MIGTTSTARYGDWRRVLPAPWCMKTFGRQQQGFALLLEVLRFAFACSSHVYSSVLPRNLENLRPKRLRWRIREVDENSGGMWRMRNARRNLPKPLGTRDGKSQPFSFVTVTRRVPEILIRNMHIQHKWTEYIGLWSEMLSRNVNELSILLKTIQHYDYNYS